MFFREKKTSKNPVLQLVENYRNTKGKVRQRIIISLGGCQVPDEYRKAVALEVTHRMNGYQRLLPVDDPEVAKWTECVLKRLEDIGSLPDVKLQEVTALNKTEPEQVCIDQIDHQESVELGPSLVLQKVWESLELDEFLKEQDFSSRQIATAKVSVFNRLIEPCSENELINWVSTTALDELLGIHTGTWGEDRFYRISDKLYSVSKSMEKHLRERECDLFNLDRTILLYDLTNSYFEGTAANNDMAKRSANSKEKRTDCPLISVGVVLDAKGFVITHKVFRGNIHDCKTLLRAVAGLEKIAGGNSRPVVVVDGGMATQENLKKLKDNGYDYVVNGKRQKRVEFANDFLEQEKFKRVEGRPQNKSKTPVFVRRMNIEEETIILCRSDGRRDKEDAIQDNAQRKLIEELEKLQARIARNDPKLKLNQDGSRVNRAIGRIASRTTRAAKLYDIEYEHPTRMLRWNRRENEWNKDRQLHGCYHLRSSIDMPDQDLWKLYMTLTKVESAFRYMKSDLGLRPFNHQKAHRCAAHIWITIIAYHLLRYTEFALELAGYEGSWKSIRRTLQTHCYTTIIVPTEQMKRIHHIRKPGRPNEQQKLIYRVLGVDWTNLPVRRKTYSPRKTCAKM